MIFSSRFALLILAWALCLHSARADQQQELESLRQRIAALQQEMEKASDTK